MAPHDINRISDRKRRRAEKRKRKKVKHSLAKPLNRNGGKHAQVSPGQRREKFQQQQQQQQQNGQRNRSSEEKKHSDDHPSLNGDGSPPPIVSGSQKRVRRNVEFVYPRGEKREVRPYVFDKHQTPFENGDGPIEAKDSRKAEKCFKETTVTDESIEDILFPKKKQKEEKKPDDSKAKARNRDVLADQEHNKKESLSKTPIKAKEQSDAAPLSSGKKRDREKQRAAPSEASDGWGRQLSGLSVEDAVRDKVGSRPRSNSTDGELKLPRRGLCDEHMVLESHKWKQASRTKSPKGLINLGNTCFLNATLQCLAYLPTFCQCLTVLPGHNMGKGKMSKGQKMMGMLRSLLRQVHNMDGGGGSGGQAIAPRAIVNAVPTIGGKSYKFRPGRQEDAHEFLVHLLDAMKDGELKAAGVDQRVSGWRDRLPIPRLDETTLIHRVFGGYLRSQVRCTACGYRSNTYDPFLDLALEVSKKSSNSIASAFSEFTRKETLDSANRWKCSGCKKYVCATKQLTVFRPPLTLCIQLKRFTFGGGFGGYSLDFGGHYGGKGMGGRGGSKITKPIEFPADLKLPLSDGRKCEYALTGIVIHVGGSASSGHYTAYVRKPGVGGGHQWYHMDDSFVEAVSEKTVLRQKDAYVLFYCRKEVKLPIPEPPPRGSMSASEARELGVARARARADSTASDDEKMRGNTSVPVTPEKPAKQPTASRNPSIASPDTQKSGSPTDKKAVTASNDSGDESSSSSSSSSSTSDSDESSTSPKDNSTPSKKATLDKTVPKTPQAALKPPPSTSGSEASVSLDSNIKGKKGTSTSLDAASSKTDVQKNSPHLPSPAANSMEGSISRDSSSSSSSDSDSDSDSTSTSSSSDAGSGSETSTAGLDESVFKSSSSESKLSVPRKLTSGSRTDATRDGVDSTKAKRSDSVSENHKETARTKVVLDRGKSRGKVEVMVGPRYKSKAWKPKTLFSKPGDKEEQQLLGNMTVGKWDDDELATKELNNAQSEVRRNVVKQMKKQESARKRRMHLDRWDAMLDEGKRKKVKAKESEPVFGNVDPKKNPFHRIQSSIQRMNRGRAKGAFRQHDKSNTPTTRRPTNRHHSNRRKTF